MPDAVSSFAVFVSPLAAAIKRLEAAHAVGKLLVRMKIPGEAGRASSLWAPPASEVIGESQLPCVRVRGMTTQQQTAAMGGARRIGSASENMDVYNETQGSIVISVMSSLKDGLVQPNTDDTDRLVPGHYDWLGRVMDALELDATGEADGSLDRSSTKPITMSTTPAEVESGLYYETLITLTVTTKPHYRAQRQFPVGV